MRNSMNINFKLIQTFLAVAERGSFRRAAEETHRATSAVSMQVRQLEEQIGAALFHRTTRHVELTIEGRQLLERARRVMTDLDEGLREIRDSVKERHGVVRVASSPTVAATLLPTVLVAFGLDYPRVTVKVRELGAQDILDAVRQREVDFGVGATGAHTADFHYQPLSQDELCALVPIKHPLAQRRRLAMTALDGVPMVMLSGFAAMRQLVEQAAEEAGITLNVQFEVQQMQTLVGMASAGLGVAVSTRLAVSSLEPLLGGLRVLGLGMPTLVREISIITARGLPTPPVAAELIRRMHGAA
jgi:DNA-binding transcriptional LysR family regulator